MNCITGTISFGGADILVCRAGRQTRMSAPRGFTFVELCIGMVVTAMVLSALAAFSLATANAWKAGESTNPVGGGKTVATIPVIGTLAGARLDNEIGAAQCTGAYYAGSLTTSTGQQASLLLWKTAATDNAIEKQEVVLIEYDSADHTIYKYTSTSSAPVLYATEFSAQSWIATFKSGATKTALARNIDGMQFYVHTPTSLSQYPLVEYRLYFSRSGLAQTRYGAVCLRSPSTPSGMNLN